METVKARLVRRIMGLVQQRKGHAVDAAQCQTELRRLGMSTGNAQRLFDDATDVHLGRLAEVARMLAVSVSDLLSSSEPVQAPPIDLAAALPIVLEAFSNAPGEVRGELSQALALLISSGSQHYYQRVAELLDAAQANDHGATVRKLRALMRTAQAGIEPVDTLIVRRRDPAKKKRRDAA